MSWQAERLADCMEKRYMWEKNKKRRGGGRSALVPINAKKKVKGRDNKTKQKIDTFNRLKVAERMHLSCD